MPTGLNEARLRPNRNDSHELSSKLNRAYIHSSLQVWIANPSQCPGRRYVSVVFSSSGKSSLSFVTRDMRSIMEQLIHSEQLYVCLSFPSRENGYPRASTARTGGEKTEVETVR